MLKLACLVRKGYLLLRRLPLIQRDPKGERQAEKLDVKVELGEGRRCVVKLVTRGDLPYTGEGDRGGYCYHYIIPISDRMKLYDWISCLGDTPRFIHAPLSYIYANFHEYQSRYHAVRGV